MLLTQSVGYMGTNKTVNLGTTLVVIIVAEHGVSVIFLARLVLQLIPILQPSASVPS